MEGWGVNNDENDSLSLRSSLPLHNNNIRSYITLTNNKRLLIRYLHIITIIIVIVYIYIYIYIVRFF